jgi:hypothetical protein
MTRPTGALALTGLILFLIGAGCGTAEFLQRRRMARLDEDVAAAIRALENVKVRCTRGTSLRYVEACDKSEGSLHATVERSDDFEWNAISWRVDYHRTDLSTPEAEVALQFFILVVQRRTLILRNPEVTVQATLPLVPSLAAAIETCLRSKGVSFEFSDH